MVKLKRTLGKEDAKIVRSPNELEVLLKGIRAYGNMRAEKAKYSQHLSDSLFDTNYYINAVENYLSHRLPTEIETQLSIDAEELRKTIDFEKRAIEARKRRPHILPAAVYGEGEGYINT